MKKKQSAESKMVSDAGSCEDIRVFQLHADEPGDPSVGIPRVYGPITVVVPNWFVPGDIKDDFERELAKFLNTWVDEGQVLTSEEKREEDRELDKMDREQSGRDYWESHGGRQ